MLKPHGFGGGDSRLARRARGLTASARALSLLGGVWAALAVTVACSSDFFPDDAGAGAGGGAGHAGASGAPSGGGAGESDGSAAQGGTPGATDAGTSGGGAGQSGAGQSGADSGAGTPGDGGPDATADAGTEDAGRDGATDAGTADAGADGNTTDASSDAAEDAAADAATGDAAADGAPGDATTDGAASDASSSGLIVSSMDLQFADDCNHQQSFTITNASGVAVSWSAAVLAAPWLFSPDPAGSTLAPGEQATVTVSVFPEDVLMAPGPFSSSLSSTLAIDSDLAGEPEHAIGLNVDALHYGAPPPPNVDFGTVFVGHPITLGVPADKTPYFVGVNSNNPAFTTLITRSDFGPDTLSVTFSPQSEGPASAVLTRSTPGGPLCPPNSSLATGIGQYDRTCSVVFDYSRCSPHALCLGGQCSLASLSPGDGFLDLSAGVETSGVVANGEIADLLSDSTTNAGRDFVAEIDWGDGTQSAGTVDGEIEFTVNGTHSYGQAGTWTITVTVSAAGVTDGPTASTSYDVQVSE